MKPSEIKSGAYWNTFNDRVDLLLKSIEADDPVALGLDDTETKKRMFVATDEGIYDLERSIAGGEPRSDWTLAFHMAPWDELGAVKVSGEVYADPYSQSFLSAWTIELMGVEVNDPERANEVRDFAAAVLKHRRSKG